MVVTAKNSKKPLSGSEDSIGYLLRNLIHDLRQMTEAAFRDAGLNLSMTHLGTLFMIQTNPGLPGAQLAKRLFITAQSMNAVLNTLEAAQLVERKSHPDNQRAYRWYVTGVGVDKLMSSFDLSEFVLQRMQSNLSEAEKIQLVDLLKRCIAGLNYNATTTKLK